MENEKIAIIALVVIIAGALTAFLVSANFEEIMNNISFQQDQSLDNVVEIGDCVDVDYTGRFADNGTVFDTSYEQVAKNANIFDENRTYEPLQIFVNPDADLETPEDYSNYSASMIQGFLEGLVGIKPGESKTVTIPPEKGYGIWNQSLAEAYQFSPQPINSPIEINWDLDRASFTQFFSTVNISENSTFDFGRGAFNINNTIFGTITDYNETNVVFELSYVNGTTFKMPFFNWNVTIVSNNETTFYLRASVEEGYVSTLDIGYGQAIHMKVVDVDDENITLAINLSAPERKFIGETLEFDLEVIELYKTSKE